VILHGRIFLIAFTDFRALRILTTSRLTENHARQKKSLSGKMPKNDGTLESETYEEHAAKLFAMILGIW
jgi:hypothetical protein